MTVNLSETRLKKKTNTYYFTIGKIETNQGINRSIKNQTVSTTSMALALHTTNQALISNTSYGLSFKSQRSKS